MIPFHSVLPELAQREVRCLHLGAGPDPAAEPALPADEYVYLGRMVLDAVYRLRLRRHYRLFREELARREGLPGSGQT
jgi:hypothetical protein